jgi:hypothetical protein
MPSGPTPLSHHSDSIHGLPPNLAPRSKVTGEEKRHEPFENRLACSVGSIGYVGYGQFGNSRSSAAMG